MFSLYPRLFPIALDALPPASTLCSRASPYSSSCGPVASSTAYSLFSCSSSHLLSVANCLQSPNPTKKFPIQTIVTMVSAADGEDHKGKHPMKPEKGDGVPVAIPIAAAAVQEEGEGGEAEEVQKLVLAADDGVELWRCVSCSRGEAFIMSKMLRSMIEDGCATGRIPIT